MARDHILTLPKGFIALRILQLITAIVVLGLAAYGIQYLSFDGDDLSLFTVRPSQMSLWLFLTPPRLL